MAKAKKTKKKAKLKIWWILAPVLLVVFITFYSLFQNNRNVPPQPEESSRYVTYQDSNFGFSVEYPQNWDVKKDTQVFENGDAIAFRISGPSQKKYTELSDGAQLAVSKPFAIDTDLAIWMKSYFTDQAKFSKLPLNNYEFEAVEECKYMECMRYYFTKIDSQVYGIALYADGTNAEKASYENALIHMLKSLKFKNSTSGTVSKEEAILKVKALPEVTDYLKRVPDGLVLINGEEDNAYMVQVYEYKNDHTATFNWYKVDKTTGEVKKEF